MPCTCWYDPPEASKRLLKQRCQEIVDEIRRLEKEGDPIGISLREAKELLEHLYRPETCTENPANSEEE